MRFFDRTKEIKKLKEIDQNRYTMALKVLDTLEKKMMKGGDKSFAAELAVYEKIYAALEAEQPARLVELDEEGTIVRDVRRPRSQRRAII